MFPARSFVLLFLVLAIVFTSSPSVQGEIGQAWESARPGVIQLMDGIYALIRNFVAGPDPLDGIDDKAPGVNFDIIITRVRGFLF